jgi:hypothetical protein
VTVWATFAPCFLWIFLGAPYIERLRGNRALNSALSAVTAAVVGVILNLAITFGIAALFDSVRQGEYLGVTFPSPDLSSLDGFECLWLSPGSCYLEIPGECALGRGRQRGRGIDVPNDLLSDRRFMTLRSGLAAKMSSSGAR